jgi:sugar phosphate isomerase/epimerase
MINEEKSSRRNFLTSSATLIAGSFLGAQPIFGAPAYIKNLIKPSSLIRGVQIGVITYSYRSMTDQSAEATLQYVLDSGISAIELMGDPAEIFAGKPKSPVDFRSVFPLMRKRNEKKEMTEAEQKQLADAEVQMKAYNAEVAAWRSSVSMDKFKQLKKMYKSAGVSIYGFKPNAFGLDNTDAEINFAMRAAKTLGASQVTLEHPSNDAHTLKLGNMALKNGIKVGYHGHEQQTPTFWDTALSQSPANALNLDLGHYVAAGNENPLDVIRKNHARISSMHIKDRTNPAHGKGNLPWGTGDTPLAEVLKLMRDQKYKFPATVELEYKIPEGSTAPMEVKKCVDFCRNILA